MKTKVTMQDIANLIGVSKVTVSRALNNKPDISDELKDKILKEAEKLGYRYNSAGNSLRSQQSFSIGILSSERFFGEHDSQYPKILAMLTKTIEEFDYTSMLHVLSLEDQKNNKLPKMYLEQKIDGLIVLGQLSYEYLKVVTEIDIPIVFLDFYDVRFDVDSINVDNVLAVYKMTNHLISLGHKKIAYVGTLSASSSINDRYLGYMKSLIENNLDVPSDYVIEDRDETGQLIPFEMPKDMPTLFVCNNDKIAFYLIEQLKKSGHKIPEEISVVGFDNSVHSELSTPKISTIRVDLQQMTRTAVKFITKKIKNPTKKYGRIFIEGQMLIRESVSPIHINNK